MIITTKRLILRPWKAEDFTPFAALNADPRVMEYFPAIRSRAESDLQATSFAEYIEKKGWGFWAVSVIDKVDFIGFIGLEDVDFEAHFTPAVEIGWRLAYEYWGQGYATEGAKAALEYAFNTLKLEEIVSLTSEGNSRSRNVMEKIGMHHDPEDDFDHPKFTKGNPLQRHVLYRILRSR